MTTTNLGMTVPTVGADSDTWGNELNTGWNHVHDDMPFVVAGGLIPGGRLLQASGPHNALLVSIAQLMGATGVTQIGNTAYGSGPLPGLVA